MARRTKKAKPLTTAQRLSSIVKSCRDIMRKDKGLNGDLDRLPMLTWIMFLKFLDDMEKIDEDRAALAGEPYRPTLEAPYRWRDWASDEAGVTGDELIAFINNDEAMRPDGIRGAGLLAYLRSLQSANGRDRRDVIARVFEGTVNRMISGYLLRDVVNKVNEIHFVSSDEMHTLSRLYETMLKEMRDAAGDSGEFYTPRPVVKFMVAVTNPKLGETILDPACGTGGFLVETFEHLKRQAETVEDRETLQSSSILGGEAKPLPYLLAQMNLLLHGLRYPRIDYGNSLATPLRDIRDNERVDVILTNPPFGGEEERGILSNFPEDKRTAETALLFLQLIMRKLKRQPKGGRAAVIVPNGTLFGDGVSARIKEELLKEFNLHTIVRLPNGVFAPYTGITTNILFFERGDETEGIWYYEIPLPEGRKNYTKTKPMRFEEFADCVAWWNKREANEQAWRVPVAEVLKYDEAGTLLSVNLDINNPNSADSLVQLPASELISRIERREQKILDLVSELHTILEEPISRNCRWQSVKLGDVIVHRKEFIRIDDLKSYKRCRVQLHARGIVLRDMIFGSEIRTKRQQVCRAGEFLVAEIDAKVGGYGIVPSDLEGAIVSSHYYLFTINDTLLITDFLRLFIQTSYFHRQISARGSTNYASVRPHEVLNYTIPLPPIDEQRRIISQMESLEKLKILQSQVLDETDVLKLSVLNRAFTRGSDN